MPVTLYSFLMLCIMMYNIWERETVSYARAFILEWRELRSPFSLFLDLGRSSVSLSFWRKKSTQTPSSGISALILWKVASDSPPSLERRGGSCNGYDDEQVKKLFRKTSRNFSIHWLHLLWNLSSLLFSLLIHLQFDSLVKKIKEHIIIDDRHQRRPLSGVQDNSEEVKNQNKTFWRRLEFCFLATKLFLKLLLLLFTKENPRKES
jgi:hypothetical protein